MPLVLSRADILPLIRMEDVIDAVRRAHVEHASGRAVQPPRSALVLPGSSGAMFAMPAMLPSVSAASFKLMSDIPANRGRGLSVQSSVVVLLETDSGACRAILEGRTLTAYRTAAASAVATSLLARSDCHVLGLIGAGNLARTHIEAMRLVLPLERVVVWSRSRETAERLVRDLSSADVPIARAGSPQEVMRTADVVCTLTPARDPIVHGAWLRPGMHLNVVGSPPLVDHREVDTDAVVRSRVVVDDRTAVARESGDLMIPCDEAAITAAHFADEIGEVAAGLKPGRADDGEITMFKSVGVAIQDLATAQLIVERAEARGLGTHVSL